jgi:DNA-binding LacI/PurR family transcriptional regulator
MKMSKLSKKITMQELARLAEVDISTVSRALNDSPLVKPETKAQILRIAEETGYAVNVAARNLRRQSSKTIGMVIPIRSDSGQTISDPFYLEMVGAVSHAASQRGYDLIISVPQNGDVDVERRLIQTGRADGLIVIGQAGRAEQLNALGPLSSKVVVWGGRVGRVKYTLVGSDNVKGGRLAAEHLLDLGRTQLLFLGDTSLPEVALRYEGFEAAHMERRLAHDPKLTLPMNFGGETTYQAVLDLLDSKARFDGIVAASDVLAMAAMHALRARGLNIPDDVAVVGYDNIGQSAMTTPPLTTIDQHIKLGGERMVDLLLRKIAGKTATSALLPTTLVVRGTCGGASDETARKAGSG